MKYKGNGMYSQVFQDEFVYFINDKKSGFFVDIGSGDWLVGSNTLYLEETGWTGICIDSIKNMEAHYAFHRPNTKFICASVPETSILSILKRYNAPSIIDYLSIDIDDSSIVALTTFPFDQYDVKVISFEHDSYASGNLKKQLSENILKQKGFHKIANDIIIPEYVKNKMNPNVSNIYFEDWWINPKYINTNNLKVFDKCSGHSVVETIKQK